MVLEDEHTDVVNSLNLFVFEKVDHEVKGILLWDVEK